MEQRHHYVRDVEKISRLEWSQSLNRTFFGASLRAMGTLAVLCVVWFLQFLSFTDYFESEGFTLGLSVGQALSSETSDASGSAFIANASYLPPLPLKSEVMKAGRVGGIMPVELQRPVVRVPAGPDGSSFLHRASAPATFAKRSHHYDDR
jgi:hypothetical protein